jgi:hypothetical protein
MRARFGTMLTNSGNSEAAYSLTGHDEDEALGFDFKPPEVTLDPGEERTVGVEVSSNPRWFGRPQSRRFSVRSASYSEPQPKSATAEFVQLALIPIWLPVVLLLVAGALGVIIPQLLHVDAPVIEDPSFTPSDQVPAMQPVTITWRVSNATSLSVPTFNMSLDLSPQNRVLNSNGTWIIERDSSNGQMIHMDAQSVAGLNGDKNIVTVELTFQTGLDHTQQFVLIAKNSKHESRKQQTLTITSPPATPTASAAAAGAGVSAATPSRTWNFANDSGDWFIGKAPRFSASIANGAYSVVVATGSLNEVIPPNSVTVADDERIAADTTLQQGSVGLVVRYTTTGSDKARTFYDCFVDTDDQFTCGVMIQDKYSMLVQPTKSGAIKHGQTNHLQLTAIGDKISFTINETTVSEFSDSQITQGSIALEINSTATDPGTGTFANVEEYLNR